MTHNCPKLEKYLFLGSSGCIFWGGRGGPGESSCHEGSEYVWQRGGRESKMPGYGQLLISPFPIAGD